MKYQVEILINLPINRVVELFDDPNNLQKWMEGLQSFEVISGEPGRSGTKSKLIYKMGKRLIEMTETIIVRDLPKEFTASYEAKGVFNIVKAQFRSEGENKTRYISKQEFQFKGFMKLMAWLMPGAFKKQSITYLEAFKQFAEKEGL